jgi:hypothetical protein
LDAIIPPNEVGPPVDAPPPVDTGVDAPPAQCVIGGTVYTQGQVNPGNACLACEPAMSMSSWSTLSDGTSCGTGSVCKTGGCVADCYIAGTFYTQGQLNPNNPCQSCQPTASTSGFTNLTDGTTCGSGMSCYQGGCLTGCNPPCTAPQACGVNTTMCCTPQSRYTVVAPGQVRDSTTGLTWTQKMQTPVGYTGAAAVCAALGSNFAEPTLAQAQSIGGSGYDTCVFQSSWDTWVSDMPGYWEPYTGGAPVQDPAGQTYVMCCHP